MAPPRAAMRSSSVALRLAVCMGLVASLLCTLLHYTVPAAFAQPSVGRPTPESRRQLLLAIGGGLAGISGTKEASAGELFALPEGKKTIAKFQKRVNEDTQEEFASSLKDLGPVTYMNNGCWNVKDASDGRKAKVVAGVIVYDPDACPKGEALIHAAGLGDFVPMTASTGPSKHKYYAGTFDPEVVISFKESVGKCTKLPKGGQDGITWQIANLERGGSC
eukprot:TRINITY_DN87191_c0_g1_i1.p1 TRINITY_DN87191_c0_g1~~TRINITY_DN87191_c0_g1_i1.p1  ORF type:complete len:236 (+),score=60.15 TRINITY_DN87191_c0_g1_i1:50-709(+)